MRSDGAGWVIAGLVVDDTNIVKQGKQVCDFMEALASVHAYEVARLRIHLYLRRIDLGKRVGLAQFAASHPGQ
jgi:hypothetical protein